MRVIVLISGLLLSSHLMAATSQLKLDLFLAQRGDVSAQYSVATAYEFGTDTKKDMKQAFDWYLKAANQSHAPSQYKVGYFYENGLGVAKNVDTAMTWYKKAKANGSDLASKRLNKTAFEQEEKEAKEKRQAIQEKLEKEEQARKAQEAKEAEEAARKAKLADENNKKAKLAAENNKKAKQQQALAAKKAQKEAEAKAAKENAAKKKAAVNMPDLLKVVLANKWNSAHGSADFLPSASTTCLESGTKELTCFSSEKTRKVNAANVTYTAKSTVVDFKNNGSFNVIYNYNGIKIDGPKTNGADVYGLAMKEGWQEPAIAIKCQASDSKNITCYRGNNQIKFTR